MATITYRTGLDGISAPDLEGFFEGWPDPPDPSTHLQILENSYRVVLAVEASRSERRAVGFVNAVSDGVLSAYIPLLEVRPACRERGIGTELVERF